MLLTGCMADSDCENYQALKAPDRNNDGKLDARYLFLGDSIVAYHDVACRSMGQQMGKALGEQVETRAVIGARLNEIAQQYAPAPNRRSDYKWVILNGGINDLIRDEEGRTDLCDCNGEVNHQACLSQVNQLGGRMSRLVNTVQKSSRANVAIMGYYPPDNEHSFIGACFPYAAELNDRYRQLSYGNARLFYFESYGRGVPEIEKISSFGTDGYHPTTAGSEVLAQQALKQLKLK